MNKLRTILTVVGVSAIAFASIAVATPAAYSQSFIGADIVRLQVSESLDLTLTGTGYFGAVSIASADIAAQNANVKSNYAAGYTLTLADYDTNTALVHTTIPANTIPTLAAAGVLQDGQSTSAWGAYIGTGTTGAGGSTFQPMPASDGTPLQIASTTAVSAAAGDNFPVTYGVQISGSQPPGTYEDIVVYTLTSK